MKNRGVAIVCNSLAVCGTAMFTGVMLSIGLSFRSYWQTLPAEDFLAWFTQHNEHVSRPIPWVALATILGITSSSWLGWGERTRRLWLAAAACIAVLTAMTFAYFVPQNTAFATGQVRAENASAEVSTWLQMHYVRIALGLSASIIAAIACATSDAKRNSERV